MNYIYDVLANFNDILYDFYDWNQGDNITHIRKIPLFKIGSKEMKDISENQVMFDSIFLEKIYQRTEIFTNRSVKGIDYACLLSDGSDALAILIKKGFIQKSKLLLEEELEVLDSTNRLKEQEIKYDIVKTNSNNPFRTRKQLEMERFLKKEISKLQREEDTSKLCYLYYECFNKKEDRKDIILKHLKEELDQHFDSITPKLYAFFKLLQVRK